VLPATSTFRSFVALWLFISAPNVVTSARGDEITFGLDSERSSLAVRGTVSAFGLNMLLREQGTGSINATHAGDLQVDLSEESIRFAGRSDMGPVEAASWEPGPFGVPGSAPASYGVALECQDIGYIKMCQDIGYSRIRKGTCPTITRGDVGATEGARRATGVVPTSRAPLHRSL
jgi:hypothetical protein